MDLENIPVQKEEDFTFKGKTSERDFVESETYLLY